jgi:hypothetical protein
LLEAKKHMVLDFTAQTVPLLSALVAGLVILAVVLFASIDPELAEVYLGDVQLLVATLALAAIAMVLVSVRSDAAHQLGIIVPGY